MPLDELDTFSLHPATVGAVANIVDTMHAGVTAAQMRAVISDLAARDLVHSADIANYFRSDKRFVAMPAGYSFYRRYTNAPFTGLLTDEVSGAVASVVAAPSAVAHPLITSRKGFTYNGTTQYHTLIAGDMPFTMASGWTLTLTFKPNVTRGGAAKTYDLVNTRVVGGTTRGVEVALRWDGVSVTNLQLIVVDDVATNKYFIGYSALDFANATTYTVQIHYSPSYGDIATLRNRFFMTVNGVFSPIPAADPGSVNLITDITSALAPRVGASQTPGSFFAGDIYSVGFIQSFVPSSLAAKVSNVERGIGKRNIIYSTDNSSDAADMGALATCVALALSGTADLVGVVADSADAYAIVAADALLTYYGLQFVPLAAWQGATPAGVPSTSLFTLDSSVTFKGGIDRTNAKYLLPSTQLAAWLTAAADASVELVMVGFAGPVAAFVAGNEALIAAKVRQITVQAGDFRTNQTNSEFNVRWDAAAWTTLLAGITAATRVVFQPQDTGEAWRTADFAGKSTASHPGARAWNLQFAGTTYLEYAWNQVAVLGAIAGYAAFDYSGPAKIAVNAVGVTGVSPIGYTTQDWADTSRQNYVASYSSDTMSTQLKTFYESFRATWLP